jgi:hypothetical protein
MNASALAYARQLLTAEPPEEGRICAQAFAGSIIVTYPAEQVAAGLGDAAEGQRPLLATLWGRPRLGRTGVRLADGTKLSWRRGGWSVHGPGAGRDIEFVVPAM